MATAAAVDHFYDVSAQLPSNTLQLFHVALTCPGRLVSLGWTVIVTAIFLA